MAPIHDDGGPAFPEFVPDHGGTFYNGMSLRDWFAGSATEKDIEAHRYPNPRKIKFPDPVTREQARYAYADAMIAARKESQP